MKIWCLQIQEPGPPPLYDSVYVKANSPWQALERAREKGIDISKVTSINTLGGRAL